ncbi:hypothetical protein ADUPG1_011781, partial [Aduncisulcus paluster]|jgi:hypothetical protein
LPF